MHLIYVCMFSVGLDGCFVKLTIGLQIRALTGMDCNNNIIPLSFDLWTKNTKLVEAGLI